MELKEIERQLGLMFNNPLGVSIAMTFIQSYGKAQYNEALEDAAKNVGVSYYGAGFISKDVIDKQSILNLKKQ